MDILEKWIKKPIKSNKSGMDRHRIFSYNKKKPPQMAVKSKDLRGQ